MSMEEIVIDIPDEELKPLFLQLLTILDCHVIRETVWMYDFSDDPFECHSYFIEKKYRG